MNYCLLVWWPLLCEKQRNCLYVMQKRLVRSLGKVTFRTHCMPIFRRFRILTISDQYYLENCKLMFKLVHNDCPKPISNMYETGFTGCANLSV